MDCGSVYLDPYTCGVSCYRHHPSVRQPGQRRSAVSRVSPVHHRPSAGSSSGRSAAD